MVCEKCGNPIKDEDRFCTYCGEPVSKVNQETQQRNLNLDEKWWTRFSKVLNITLYIPLLIIIYIVWSLNSTTLVGSLFGEYEYKNTYGKAFWYSFIVVLIYVAIMRIARKLLNNNF
ncbi:MAG: hypothetical protein A2566_03770 [Candidatus Zambryskibacteria bacterium RIFOXYD1_FULL_40_13]|nr:MAG: hypothetical protein UT25_C0002G0226 [Parcubacteria group bacterium GW2011_GWC1_39_12]KKR19274.1 MAG: hypothetical protein UT49_C0002G0120 [Parcubacteria group bacterium GW2011_GWF1_39_37]KKR35343.1 MAG: hypothetical protein UT68_C0004G0151 [Parcubacteria group bacterium GW2011_GWC2_40_10]KKR52225.1 MAG: hypothetical protein UT89_C0002G0026 [Parcubacteria group bacterium GW2011_GWE1_40_20]KKR65723.1 MAG: hypothetical protein UU06_C0012G0019 [Parcubacteria group bacterium GW2011_GWB1_40_